MIVDELISKPVRGTLSYQDSGAVSAVVLLCGPNPFLGGQPDNPVLHALASALLEAGAIVLTIEYPAWNAGLAAEEFERLRAQFWSEEFIPDQMPQDVIAGTRALEFLGNLSREFGVPLVAAGYSYGGALALELTQCAPIPVLAISPPLRTLSPSSRLVDGRCVVIRAREDLALSSDEVAAFQIRSSYAFQLDVVLEAEDHFFMRELPTIARTTNDWLTGLLAGR
jgi:alpha/beta superfamily hydrolase